MDDWVLSDGVLGDEVLGDGMPGDVSKRHAVVDSVTCVVVVVVAAVSSFVPASMHVSFVIDGVPRSRPPLASGFEAAATMAADKRPSSTSHTVLQMCWAMSVSPSPAASWNTVYPARSAA